MALTLEERVEVILLCGRKGYTQKQVADEFNAAHPQRPPITHSAVSKLLKRFKKTGSVADQKRSGRPRSATNDEIATDILAMIEIRPKTSTRQIAAEAAISHNSVLRVLKRNKFRPFKMQILHTLHEDDPDRRVDFCEWAESMLERDPSFPKRILFSDEALFSISGSCNKQTCRYWSQTNPHWMAGLGEQGAPTVMVWCGILNDSIVGPYFFEGNVTSESYLAMLGNFMVPELALAEVDPEQIWFQQDGAPPHFALSVRHWLEERFPNWIGRRGTVEWPARSPDLTPLDFFLWGYIKSRVFDTKPANLQELRERIVAACNTVTPVMLERVHREWVDRLAHCIIQNGAHIEHL